MRPEHAVLAACLLAASAHAGCWRDDVGSAPYEALALEPRFDGVGQVSRRQSNGALSAFGAGTYLGNGWVLTAGHVATGMPLGEIRFILNGQEHTVASRHWPSGWDARDPASGDDIALLRLHAPLEGVPAARIWTGDRPDRATVISVGYGVGGNGVAPAAGNRAKRAGTNVIDRFGNVPTVGGTLPLNPRVFTCDFDSPHSSAANTIVGSSPTPTALEYLAATNDSGGSVWIEEGGQSYVVGVHSFVVTLAPTLQFLYGDMYSSTYVPAHLPWIRATMGVCRADLDGDFAVGVADLLAYLGLFRAQDPAADWDGDARLDVTDLLGFLGDFRNACGD